MSKQLKPLNFSGSILNDYDNFHFCIKSNKMFNANNPMITKVFFEWEWNNYSGYGDIYLKNGKLDLEDYLCSSSQMTVGSKSIKRITNGRDECALYNDEKLKIIFEWIINQKQH